MLVLARIHARWPLGAIAKARLRDAQVLLRAKRFDGAFYLCGYSVEVALKSRICRTLKWGGFSETGLEFKGLQSVKTHDLEVSALVVSAPWLEKGKLKATSEFVGLLTEAIGEQALRYFSRIQTISMDDPALKAVLAAFSVDDGEIRVQKSNLFGLEIEDAIILRSRKPGREALPSTAMEPTART